MIATIRPSVLNGSISIPASKSAMQRACALALLRRGKTIISDPGNSEDELRAVSIIEALGADVSKGNGSLEINASGRVPMDSQVDCGESGLSLRMFSIIAGMFEKELTFRGTGTLRNRRVDFPEAPLAELGVKYRSTNGVLPITVQGPVKPGSIGIEAPPGSQYLTGLLFLLAATAKEPLTLTVSGKLVSRPYIDLSLEMLNHFGFSVAHQNYVVFQIHPASRSGETVHYKVEGDWSNAAFFVVAAAIKGDVTLSGLRQNSSQGDKVILDIVESAGAILLKSDDQIRIQQAPHLRSFFFDATDYPDLFPPLVALAVNCDGETVIKGAARLKGKESDRASTLIDAFSALGADIRHLDDELRISGGKALIGTALSSYNDHRLVMSCAIAALGSDGSTFIRGAEAVAKSFPSFFDQLSLLGADVSLATE